MNKIKGEKKLLSEIVTECIYIAKLDELLKLNLITNDEYIEVKKTLNSL